MPISNQLRKDLEGFLEDLYKTGQLPARLKEEDLVAKVSPKIDDFFQNYISPIYNSERVEQLRETLTKEIYNYTKIDSDFKNAKNRIENACNTLRLMMGSWYLGFALLFTGSLFLGVVAYMIGDYLVARKGIPITKEYIELETKRKQKIEEILN